MTTDMPVKPVALTSLTLAQIVAMVRTVASERPERIAAPPVGRGACSYIRSADDSEEGCPFGGTIGSVLVGLGMVNAKERSIEYDRYRWLSVVQANQDNGARWSLCVMRADEGFPNV